MIKLEQSVQIERKQGDCMTGKEIVNLIRKLREKGIDSDEILKIIEYVETHEPHEDSETR